MKKLALVLLVATFLWGPSVHAMRHAPPRHSQSGNPGGHGWGYYAHPDKHYLQGR